MKFDNWRQWLNQAVRVPQPRGTPGQRWAASRFRPTLERLEDRLAPASVSVTSISATTPTGQFTNAASVTYTITFSAATLGLTASNLSLTGTGAAGLPTSDIGTPATIDRGLEWTDTISNLGSLAGTGDTLILNLANATGLTNTVSTPLPFAGDIYTFSPASVTSITGTTPAGLMTNASSVTYTITFSSAIAGLTVSNFTVTGTAGVPATDIGTPATTDNGLQWTVTVSGLATNGTLTLNLANDTGLSDTISNTLPFAGSTYTLNYTSPTTTISAPVETLVSGKVQIAYTVTYVSADFGSSNLATGNITLDKTGTTTATVNVSAGTGATRTVTLTNITGRGTLGITIAAGTAVDAAGNLAAAPAGPSATVTVAAPIFTTASTGFTAGFAGSFQVTATGAPATMTFSLTGAPSWLKISAKGVLTGTPPLSNASLVQTVTFTINASNGVSADATETFTLSIFQPRRRGAA